MSQTTLHYAILDEHGNIVGYSHGDTKLLPGYQLQAISPEPLNTQETIMMAQQNAIMHIKQQAEQRLAQTQWRIERAKERDFIGAEGESLCAVYAEREAIRRASNRGEQEIRALPTIEALSTYHWQVLPQDYPQPSKITRLAFMRRFTSQERAQLSAIRHDNPALDDFWQLLDVAQNIDLNDPEIKTAVHYLEQSKLLKKGRAKVILHIETDQTLH